MRTSFAYPTYLTYIILWEGFVLGGFGYVVFWLGASGWWMLLAAFLSAAAYTPSKWGQLVCAESTTQPPCPTSQSTLNGRSLMRTYIWRLRTWLLLKLAAGHPVALNLKLTRGLYIYGSDQGLYVNVCVNPSMEYPGAPGGCGVYISVGS